VPGGLEHNELNAVESMLEREYHWQKITNAILKQRDLGYVA